MSDQSPDMSLRDHVVAGAITIGSFIVLYVRYWFPPAKIFDEIYFARAAEEYLQRRYIYESTHPPTTKLLITLSTWMFGGLHGGDNATGWRFLDVVFGALMVWLLYVLAKRITRSTLFSGYAAALLALDGMHFAQSRIATPESFVGVFSLATLYTFLRYWTAVPDEPRESFRALRRRGAAVGAGIVAGLAVALTRFGGDTTAAKVLVVVYGTALCYAAYLAYFERRFRSASDLWLVLFAVSISLLVTSKWYGVMAFGVAFTIIAGTALVRFLRDGRWSVAPFRIDLILATVVGVLATIYAAAYIPQFVGLRDLPNYAPRAYSLSEIVSSQYGMYSYHASLVATHPYASSWWQWPLDLRPILYYADYGHGPGGQITTAAMIYSLPNPFILWLGLLCVPAVAYFAVRERNKAYTLIILSYLFQWLPWMRSPRISFAYHFYVDIAPTCLCIAIVMQRLWNAFEEGNARELARFAVLGYLIVVAAGFVYFYPELAGVAIPYDRWYAHLWLHSWL